MRCIMKKISLVIILILLSQIFLPIQALAAPGDDDADLSIKVLANPDPVTAGDDLTYSIQITNNGPSVASDVYLFDMYPLDSLTVQSTTQSQGTLSQSLPQWGIDILLQEMGITSPPPGYSFLAWSVGDMAEGTSVDITIVATVNPDIQLPFPVLNRALVMSTTNEPYWYNNYTEINTTHVSPRYFTVDFLGKITRVLVSEDLRPLNDVVAYSPDNTHLLEIEAGTGVFYSNGNPATRITIRETWAPQLPNNTELVGEALDFAYSGMTLSQPIRLTLGYNVEDLPDGFLSIDTAYYDTDLGWSYLNSEGNQVAGVGSLMSEVNHFTKFAILALVPAEIHSSHGTELGGSPVQGDTSFILSNLTISTSESEYGKYLTYIARHGEDAAITIDVTNTGSEGGVYQAVLLLNGVEQDTITINLEAGETRNITFNTTENEPSNYTVQIGGLTGEFNSELWINWWLIVGSALVFVLLCWLVFNLFRTA